MNGVRPGSLRRLPKAKPEGKRFSNDHRPGAQRDGHRRLAASTRTARNLVRGLGNQPSLRDKLSAQRRRAHPRRASQAYGRTVVGRCYMSRQSDQEEALELTAA